METKVTIEFKCGKDGCSDVGTCEIGYNARLDHMHKNADGDWVHFYPVKIIGITIQGEK